MLVLVVQSWFVLTVSLLTVLALVVGAQRALRVVRRVAPAVRSGVAAPVPPSKPQLVAVPRSWTS